MVLMEREVPVLRCHHLVFYTFSYMLVLNFYLTSQQVPLYLARREQSNWSGLIESDRALKIENRIM